MRHPITLRHDSAPARGVRFGFTLVELLVATVLTLIMVGGVVAVFATVAATVSDSRATMEMTDKLRNTVMFLQHDLGGATTTMLPPRSPDAEEGYFEIVQGPVGISAVTNTGATPAVYDQNPFSAGLPTSGGGSPTSAFPYIDVTATALKTAWKLPNGVLSTSPSLTFTPPMPDATCGKTGDILMFTTRSTNPMFTGRCGGSYIQSPVAEVAWFMRGRTLYRRVLLVAPWLGSSTTNTALGMSPFYQYNDISVRYVDPTTGAATNILTANSLGDLTNRENRFMHYGGNVTATQYADTFPYPWTTLWCTTFNGAPSPILQAGVAPYQLPTLNECCGMSSVTPPTNPLPYGGSNGWMGTVAMRSQMMGNRSLYQSDLWASLNVQGGYAVRQPIPGPSSSPGRFAEDVVLTNVIGFDVKVWDPGAPIYQDNTSGAAVLPDDPGYAAILSSGGTQVGAGAYVNLGYNLPSGYKPPSATTAGSTSATIAPQFACKNNDAVPYNLVVGTVDSGLTQVYDTWSTRYSQGFAYQGSTKFWPPLFSNGFDDFGYGMVGSPATLGAGVGIIPIAQPPYPYPLRGIQVKIRTFEPDSRQVREMTVVQDFVRQ